MKELSTALIFPVTNHTGQPDSPYSIGKVLFLNGRTPARKKEKGKKGIAELKTRSMSETIR